MLILRLPNLSTHFCGIHDDTYSLSGL
jgi:hypothetical protein